MMVSCAVQPTLRKHVLQKTIFFTTESEATTFQKLQIWTGFNDECIFKKDVKMSANAVHDLQAPAQIVANGQTYF